MASVQLSGFKTNIVLSSLTSMTSTSAAVNTETSTQLGIVTMYKKDSCPYCKAAKELLEGTYGLKITYVDIENELT